MNQRTSFSAGVAPQLRTLLTNAFGIAFLFAWSGVALSAQTPTAAEGDQFLVNTYTTNIQETASVAVGAGGETVVVWHSHESDEDPDLGIRARLFDAQGVPVGDDFLVNSYTTAPQYRADVAVDAEGGFVVVWSSFGSDNGDPDLFSIQARRFDSNGLPMGDSFLVNSYTTNSQFQASIAMADAGDFVVVWTSEGSIADPTTGVHGRRFASNGDPLGDQFLVATYTTSLQQEPAVAMDGEGDFVVAWQSVGPAATDPDSTSVQARLFSSSGSPLGDQFQVNTYTPGAQHQPDLAVDTDGDFVVVWRSFGSDNGDDSETSVQGRRFSSNGTPAGPEFLVNTYTLSFQQDPSVTMDQDGDFVVAWWSTGNDSGDSDVASIQGQRYEQDGTPVGDQFLVNAYTTGGQSHPSVAAQEHGDFVAVWQSIESDNGDVDSGGIQGQRFRVTADVGDLVFRDENLDGLQTPGETGEPGVAVHLHEAGGALLDSTTTDEEGSYLFRPKIALYGVADEFYVRFEEPDDLEFTAPDVGDDDTLDSDAEPISGETDNFIVASAGENRTDLDAGLAAGLGDRVWQDLDGDGVQDEGEPGVDGVFVELYDGLGVLEDSTTTSGSGQYAFFGLESGTYYLGFTAPTGTVFTARDQGGDDAVDSDVNSANGTTAPFVFSGGELRTDWDAGLVDNLAQIGDRVWLDSDGDGVQDGGEVGAEGVTVNLYREPDPPSPTELATLEATDVTDSDGLYRFEVEPGTYYLELVCPAGSFTAQNQGGDDTLDSDVNPATGTTSPFILALGAPDDTRDGGLLDGDADGVATCVDNCSGDSNPGQVDSDGDGLGDPCDLCAGDDAGGDGDADGLCAGSPYECDDGDPTNACAAVFDDGFESGDTSAWSTTVN